MIFAWATFGAVIMGVVFGRAIVTGAIRGAAAVKAFGAYHGQTETTPVVESPEDDGGLSDLYALELREWDDALYSGRPANGWVSSNPAAASVSGETHTPASDPTLMARAREMRERWFAIRRIADDAEQRRQMARWESDMVPFKQAAKRAGLVQ